MKTYNTSNKNTTMKKVTKLLAAATVAVAIFIGSSAKAQTITPNKLRFGVGVEGGAVTGEAHDYSNLELGGTARLQYGLSNNFAITLTSGYYNFFGKTVPGTNDKYQSEGMVPVKAGIKYFFTDNLYFGAEAGVGIETKAFALPSTENVSSDQVTNNKLLLTPGVGWANKHWDVGARYENYSGGVNSYGLVGLRVAYGFGL
jgi:hypothetical protein